MKEPDERCQSAKDLTEELKWIAEGGSPAGKLTSAITGRTSFLSSTRLSWSLTAVLLVALLLGAFAYFRRAPQNLQLSSFFVFPPETWTLTQQLGPTGSAPIPLAVSPDGRRIAFVATSADGRTLLWVRALDTLNAQALTGTEGAARPFWSPDGRFLGFFADGKLKKIEVAGGPPLALCDALSDRSGTWSQDGVIVFAPTSASALQKVSASGGTPTPATVLGPGEIAHRRPVFLPDGRHFLYRAITGLGPTGPIYLASLDSTERKLLLNVDSGTVLYTQGYLLFLRGTTLMGQPFDTRGMVLTGEAFPIAEQIQIQSANPGFGLFSASQNGVLAYQTGTWLARNRLVWFDRTGKQTGVLGDPATYDNLQLSPDGKRASVGILDQAGKKRDIWLYDMASGLRTRLTFAPADVIGSIWSPDGSRVVFNSSLKGHLDLYQKASSGAGAEELLLEDNQEKYPLSWSPDGQFILYSATSAATGHYDLFVLPLSGDRKPFPLLQTRFIENAGQFSPDGRWVAYQSDESGRFELYVVPFRGPGGKWQVSTGGGAWPRWRRDGSELFYLTPDNKVMVAAVNGKGTSFEVGSVKPVLQTPLGAGLMHNPYDVSVDGQRLLINSYQEQTASAPITVVLNWTAGLKK